MEPKAKFTGKKTVNTYVYLKSAAQELLKIAERTEEGCYYTAMMSVVGTAFFVEAYLNHIGSELFPYWKQLEKRLAPHDKLTMICHALKIKPNMGVSPYQSFGVVFAFRNMMGHGKTETITGTWVGGEQGASAFHNLKLKWESLCEPESARKCFNDGVSIVEQLHEKAGKGEAPFAVAAVGFAKRPIE